MIRPPPCVRPDHLFPGTVAMNNADRAAAFLAGPETAAAARALAADLDPRAGFAAAA